ncbi:hypothetical protein PG997_003423 [Apiospora hydei]|uniref:Uncharacterized protein n=1 Tax=Apiospora hydei TaxID=1337664 RepID=A0ABR1WZ71_9PEZI
MNARGPSRPELRTSTLTTFRRQTTTAELERETAKIEQKKDGLNHCVSFDRLPSQTQAAQFLLSDRPLTPIAVTDHICPMRRVRREEVVPRPSAKFAKRIFGTLGPGQPSAETQPTALTEKTLDLGDAGPNVAVSMGHSAKDCPKPLLGPGGHRTSPLRLALLILWVPCPA